MVTSVALLILLSNIFILLQTQSMCFCRLVTGKQGLGAGRVLAIRHPHTHKGKAHGKVNPEKFRGEKRIFSLTSVFWGSSFWSIFGEHLA